MTLNTNIDSLYEYVLQQMAAESYPEGIPSDGQLAAIKLPTALATTALMQIDDGADLVSTVSRRQAQGSRKYRRAHDGSDQLNIPTSANDSNFAPRCCA